MKKHFLFICSANMRSRTAAELFENSEDVEARSAALTPFRNQDKITDNLIRWTGTIFVVNEKEEFHKTQLLQQFPDTEDKEIVDLNIPSELAWDDPRLKTLLKTKLQSFL
ncbi:MAG: phosphotyrosine protein phosphatase [Candidatus Nanoarchaeia archaeon]